MIIKLSRQRSGGFTRTQWLAIICLVIIAFEVGVRVAERDNALARTKPKPAITNHPMTAPTAIVEEPPAVLQTGEVVVAVIPPPPRTNPPPTPPSPVGPGPVPQMKKAQYETRVHKIPEQRRQYYPVTNMSVGIRVALP
jgi:hypothetical protein